MRKHYGMIRAVDDVDLEIGVGADRRDRGRQRRGQVDADQDALGRGHPRQRRDPLVGGAPAGSPRPNDARHARHRDDLPGPRPAAEPRRRRATSSWVARRRSRGPLGALGILARRRMREEAQAAPRAICSIRIPRIWGTPVGSLSGGQRQSVAIARAMVWASRLVIMDEPTAALGVAQSQAVLELVRARPRARHVRRDHQPHPPARARARRPRSWSCGTGARSPTCPPTGVSQDDLIELIVGFELGDAAEPDSSAPAADP